METRVVNKRVSEFDVYIGRGSKWGNPFRIGVDGSRDQVIERYQAYICKRPALLADLPELQGKRLGCFCAPSRCHGDVLIDLILFMEEEGLDAVLAWARRSYSPSVFEGPTFDPPLGPGE